MLALQWIKASLLKTFFWVQGGRMLALSQAIRSWPGIIGGHGLPGTKSIKPLGHFLRSMPSDQCYISPSTVLSLAFICEDISSAFYYGPWTDDTSPSPLPPSASHWDNDSDFWFLQTTLSSRVQLTSPFYK